MAPAYSKVSHPAQLLYPILGLEFVASVSLALSFGFRTESVWKFVPPLFCFLLILSGPLARRIDRPGLGEACESVGFLYGQSFALVALLYPMTAIAAPFADARLAAADKALGFNWPCLASTLQNHHVVLDLLRFVYFSFDWQGALILPLLIWCRRSARAWITIFASNIALLVTLLVYPIAPAEGTFTHYGITPNAFPNMTAKVAWSFGPAIHAVRDQGVRHITSDLMVPFVSFPSYHAVAAVLFAYAAWPLKHVRWPFLILNIFMSLSALIIGAHYLVDLIAGAAVGVFAIYLAGKALRRFQL